MANGTRKPMRQGQQNRRGRGRGRKPQNPLSRNLESNGPDVKIRGTASHIAEKYTMLARDSQVAGDYVAGESYLQHAEHYNRIIMANQAQQQTSSGQGDGMNGAGRDQQNGSPEGAGTVQPEVAASVNPAKSAGDDDGVARTMARSANGGDDAAEAADTSKKDSVSDDDAGVDEAPDEALT